MTCMLVCIQINPIGKILVKLVGTNFEAKATKTVITDIKDNKLLNH